MFIIWNGHFKGQLACYMSLRASAALLHLFKSVYQFIFIFYLCELQKIPCTNFEFCHKKLKMSKTTWSMLPAGKALRTSMWVCVCEFVVVCVCVAQNGEINKECACCVFAYAALCVRLYVWVWQCVCFWEGVRVCVCAGVFGLAVVGM